MTDISRYSWVRKSLGLAFRVLVSVAILSAGVLVYRAMGKAETRRTGATLAAIPSVQVAIASSYEEGIPFSVDGVVVPYRQIGLAAEVSGRVAFKADECRSGRTVRKGQLLLRIDTRDYDLEIERLEQEHGQASAAIAELEVQIENAKTQIQLAEEDHEIRKRELQRYINVRDPGAVSGSEIDTAKRNELAARNTLQSQRDRLRETQSTRTRLERARDLVAANLERARLNLKRCEIYSPLDGIVVQDEVEQDGYVAQGTTVAVVQDSSQVEVACKLYMSQVNWLWQAGAKTTADNNAQAFDFPETPVEVVYELGSATYVWDGKLTRYEGAGIDDQTRMAPCRVYVGQPLQARHEGEANTVVSAPPTLMTGMFVEVRVRVQPSTPLLRIPSSAVQPGNKVWVVRDTKLQQTTVRVAGRNATDALIYVTPEGPTSGDEVVVSPLATPAEGQQVEVREEA